MKDPDRSMTGPRQEASASAATATLPCARLRLLATSDLHMHLGGHDYHADRPDPSVGLTRVASLIAAARAEAMAEGAAVLLLDNGDALQGTPLGDMAAVRSGGPHLMMRAFRHLGYDALGLGNHDFNFGLEALDRILADAPCTVLSSNLRAVAPSTLGRVAGFAILERTARVGMAQHSLRIGVLSFLPPQTLQWDSHLLAGRIEIADIVASARTWVPRLRRQGCDMIVALAHSGLGPATDQSGENAAIPLAGVDGIDAVIAGHTHLLLPGTDHAGLAHVDACAGSIHGKPAAMPGAAGSHLAVLDLDLAPAADGRWRVARARCELRPISRRRPDGTAEALVPEDPDLVRLIAPDHAATRDEMARPVGHSTRTLHSYFAFVAPDRSLALVAAAQAAALRPHLVGTEAADLPLLSAASPPKTGGRAGPLHYTDVPSGPVSRRHVADLCGFPNRLRAVIVTGAQVLDWLDRAASLFARIAPGSHAAKLVDRSMPGYDFDVLHGLEYRIELATPPRFTADGTVIANRASRIRDLRHDGRPLHPEQRFVVALNSYRASGGGRVAALADAVPVPLPPIAIRDAVTACLAGSLAPDPLELATPWRFAPMPGTTVTALTGPGAVAHLGDLAGRGIVAEGLDKQGFLRLIVPL